MSTPENSAVDPVTAAQKSSRTRPTQTLPTDRIAFSKQMDLLRVYAAASGATRKVVTLSEIESVIKMKASTVSLANPFFTDTGLIQRAEKGFIPSDAVLNFNRAFQWNPETAAYKLAPIIQTTWFWNRLGTTLGFRSMSEDEAINVLADASNASPEYKPQLALLIEYVVACGLVVRDGGQLTAVTNIGGQDAQSPTAASSESAPANEPAPVTRSSVTTSFAQPMEGTVQFHVSVRVDMSEFASWRPERITAFFGGIAAVLAAKGALEKHSADK